uniref:Uncharacterized protein n=1 Tax=Cacopsylla melanoneura TaxID=428564 RepID=A0A8D9DWQ1_9HEMI
MLADSTSSVTSCLIGSEQLWLVPQISLLLTVSLSMVAVHTSCFSDSSSAVLSTSVLFSLIFDSVLSFCVFDSLSRDSVSDLDCFVLDLAVSVTIIDPLLKSSDISCFGFCLFREFFFTILPSLISSPRRFNFSCLNLSLA